MVYRGIVVVAVVGALGCASKPGAPVAQPANVGIAEADRECGGAHSDGERCFLLGVQHQVGSHLASNDPVARRYFALACDRGSARGCLYFAQELLIATDDVTNAMKLAARACDAGNREACAFAGEVAHRAFVVTKGADWRVTACELGQVEDCEGLLRDGQALPEIKANRGEIYRQACNDHLAAACSALPALIQAEQAVLLRFVAAVAKRDTQAFGEVVAASLDVGGLGNEGACSDPDLMNNHVLAAQHPALLACLAPLGLHVEPASEPVGSPEIIDRQHNALGVDIVGNTVVAIARRHAPEERLAPSPDGRPVMVPPQTLQVNRIAGDNLIVPDDKDKAIIARSGNTRRIGSFRVCIDTHGDVTDVTRLKSTGVFAYDRKIERTIFEWRYRPLLIDGQPTAVCTNVTFIYSQQSF